MPVTKFVKKVSLYYYYNPCTISINWCIKHLCLYIVYTLQSTF